MKTPVISNELKDALKRLRLGRILDTLGDRLLLAEKQEMPTQDFLLLVLSDEIARRQNSAAQRRADDAGLDPDMVFERWDKTAKVHFERRVLTELTSLRYIEGHRNVVILGPVGVGKTFIAHALGHLACRAGFQVRVYRADEMLRLLRQSRMDNSRDALMTALTTIDLLIIDDFALESMARDESRDVYQLFIERNARLPTIVTSNRLCRAAHKRFNAQRRVMLSRKMIGAQTAGPTGRTHRATPHYRDALLKGGRHAHRDIRFRNAHSDSSR